MGRTEEANVLHAQVSRMQAQASAAAN
jgi:hypothetical protein